MSRPDIEINALPAQSDAARRERDGAAAPKTDFDHVEKADAADVYDADIALAKRNVAEVADTDARGYVDPNLVISPEEDKRLRWMIHKRVLPIMCCVYIVQALDKGALGPVSIMGWLEDVNAQGQDYALTSTVMWAGIICGEPFVNQIIRRFPVGKILACTMVVWTALVFGLAFTMTIPPVFANRFLIGLFESSFGPCLLTITVQWYKREEQPMVSAIWQSMSAAASSVVSIMAWGFYQVEYDGTGLRGWQWLILCLGIISAISTVLTYFFLPDSPTSVRWADAELKTKLVERVRANDQGLKQKVWKSEQAWEAVKDPYTYLLFGLAFSQTLVVGGIGKFNSLLINRAFGFDVLTSQLVKIPMSFVAVAFYILIAWLIQRYNQTLYTMIGFVFINIIGTIVLITVEPSEKSRPGLLIAFFAMHAFMACNPAIFSMLSRNSAGQTKKSITYALTYIGWAGGNAISPQIFWNEWAPRYLPGLYIHLGLYGCFIGLCLLTRLVLSRRNAAKIAAQTDAQGQDLNRNENAFEDLTDIQNPDFRYNL